MVTRLKTLIEDYLEQAKLLQVVTSENNQPWACTVYFAYDRDMNLYWISKPSCRHSQELRKNNKVAGTIVLPHLLGDKVRGLQLQGFGFELTEKSESLQGIKHYAKRFGIPQERVEGILNGSDGHVCYKITPSVYVLFDEVNYPDNPRQEYKL